MGLFDKWKLSGASTSEPSAEQGPNVNSYLLDENCWLREQIDKAAAERAKLLADWKAETKIHRTREEQLVNKVLEAVRLTQIPVDKPLTEQQAAEKTKADLAGKARQSDQETILRNRAHEYAQQKGIEPTAENIENIYQAMARNPDEYAND